MEGAKVVVMQAVPLGEVVVFGSRLWVKVGVPWEAEEVDLVRELQVDCKRIQHSSALSPSYPQLTRAPLCAFCSQHLSNIIHVILDTHVHV